MRGLNLGLGFSRGGAGSGAAGGVPVNTVPPSIRGLPISGGLLICDPGVWTGGAFTFEWFFDGVSAGTGNTINNISFANEGKVPTCVVTATNGIGSANATATCVSIAYTTHYTDANDPNNVVATVDKTFTSSAVDLVNNVINITDYNFVRSNPYYATPVWVETTGTPPAPLVAGRKYLVCIEGSGLAFYPYNSDADWASIDGFIEGETVSALESYGLNINRIVFTDGGTGTHRLRANPLATTIYGKTGRGNHYVLSDLNRTVEVKEDSYGKYFDFPGAIGRHQDDSNGPFYGKLYSMQNQGVAFGNMYTNRRLAAFFGKVGWDRNMCIGQKRVIISDSQVNTVTGVISNTGHAIPTGTKVEVGYFTGNPAYALPTGISPGNLYFRSLSASTFALYPTATDATNDTNRIIPSTQGVGYWYVLRLDSATYWPRRQILLDNCVESNGHEFSPVSVNGGSIALQGTTGVFPSGGNDGNVLIDLKSQIGISFGHARVRVFVPKETVTPTRSDTGLPLSSGIYWITITPENTARFRFHATEQDAIDSIGVATATAKCIKYSARAASNQGSFAFAILDKFVVRHFHDAPTPVDPFIAVSDTDTSVWAIMCDYNNPSINAQRWYAGRNALWNLMNSDTATPTRALASGVSQSTCLFGNAGQPHVPAKARFYKGTVIVGDDPALMNAQGQMCMDYWLAN